MHRYDILGGSLREDRLIVCTSCGCVIDRVIVCTLRRSNQTSSHTAWAGSSSTALPGCGQPGRRHWVWILGRFTPNVPNPWIKCLWPDFKAERKTRGTAKHSPLDIWCQQRLMDGNNTDSGAAKKPESLWSRRHWVRVSTYLRVFNHSSVSGTFRPSFQNYRSYFGPYTLDTKQESWKQPPCFFRWMNPRTVIQRSNSRIKIIYHLAEDKNFDWHLNY